MKGVDYASGTVPPDYRCASCGAHGCKLWREYQCFKPSMFCVACAEQIEGKRLETGPGASDQIGWHVPAVPTEEGGGLSAVHPPPLAYSFPT